MISFNAGHGADEAAAALRQFQAATGLDKIKEQPYQILGTLSLVPQKLNGAIEVLSTPGGKQWFHLDIPEHQIYLRATDGTRSWHFDPPQGTRSGDGGAWHIYPRPGYRYEENEAQSRLHEILNVFASQKEGAQGGSTRQARFRDRDVMELRKENRSDFFDQTSGLRVAVEFRSAPAETVLLEDYAKFHDLRIPTKITNVRDGKTNEIFHIDSLTFTNVPASKFAMPLTVRDWPKGWNEFEEAYPPPTFVKGAWPWNGEHSRYFSEGFDQTNSVYFWSYVVFNRLKGDTLKTEEEVIDALHRYDAALYGEAFSPEKIKVRVISQESTEKLGHAVSVRHVQIDGFDAETTRRELRTYLKVYRWRCPVANRTGMLVLRSPKAEDSASEPWKTLDLFWGLTECHAPGPAEKP